MSVDQPTPSEAAAATEEAANAVAKAADLARRVAAAAKQASYRRAWRLRFEVFRGELRRKSRAGQ